MPLYIVRWANLSATLIRADDEDHLELLLDEVGDPGAAIWEEYDGPLWLELNPKRRESEQGGFEIVDDFDSETGPWDILRPGVASADTCDEMYWSILERLFPHLHVALQKTAGSDLPTERAKAIIKGALEREGWHMAAITQHSKGGFDERTLLGKLRLSVLPQYVGAAVTHALEEASKEGRDVDVDGELAAMAAQMSADIAWRAAQLGRLETERRRAQGMVSDSDEG